jgi:hypothetical protein
VNRAATEDWLEYVNTKNNFKMKFPKNASPREWYEDGMVSFNVENLPKLQFGKIVIHSGAQSNITTEDFFNQSIPK